MNSKYVAMYTDIVRISHVPVYTI